MPELKLFICTVVWRDGLNNIDVETYVSRSENSDHALAKALSDKKSQDYVRQGKAFTGNLTCEVPEESLKRLGIKLVDPEG